MATWYCNYGNGTTTGYYAVATWAASTAYSIGDLRRQLATPAVGSERVFRCTTAGTSGATAPTWVLTKGATTTDGTVTWTEVTGDSTYNWAAPHARIANALSWAAAGDTVYVSQAHAETQTTAIGLTSPGTAGALTNVFCVQDSGTPGALATTATVTTTGTSGITFINCAHYYGITFNMGTGGTTATIAMTPTAVESIKIFTLCKLVCVNTSSGAAIQMHTTSNSQKSQLIVFDNTIVQFSAVGQGITVGNLIWKNQNASVAVVAGTLPTALFKVQGTTPNGFVRCEGINLSSISTGKYLVAPSTGTADILFKNCKLGAAVTVLNTPAISGQGGVTVRVDNCDTAAGTNYRMEHYKYQGSIKSNTTATKTGGASDGTTAISWVMANLASTTNYAAPLESPEISIWNETLSAITVSVDITQADAGTNLTDGECWLEVSYLGTTGVPLASIASSRGGDILTPGTTTITASSATWTTGFNTKKQTLSVSITPAVKGFIQAKVCLAPATASTQVVLYVDPKLTVA